MGFHLQMTGGDALTRTGTLKMHLNQGGQLLPSPPGAPYAIAHLQAIHYVDDARLNTTALAQHFALQQQPL